MERQLLSPRKTQHLPLIEMGKQEQLGETQVLIRSNFQGTSSMFGIPLETAIAKHKPKTQIRAFLLNHVTLVQRDFTRSTRWCGRGGREVTRAQTPTESIEDSTRHGTEVPDRASSSATLRSSGNE
ncbi:hypothetical protein K0M31_011911 [Melipona bicolor]|uniref:Uncharacterized protein n=1 Tax=Melipona bicolor TaxID=60889 RepID=A0AA40GAG2_9HYME|nr:hypothetical protein K0M31_011911 [Melipona bicolor]